MLVIFIGPPGAGKGTQANRLTDYLGTPHISTGEMLRQAQAEGSELGMLASKYIDQGQLAPDALVVKIVGKRLDQPDCLRGCLFDGFPRTISQAHSLDDYLAATNREIGLVIELSVPKKILLERLAARSERGERRVDDAPETIPNRLRVYRNQTAPLLEYYRDKNLLATIDAVGSPDEVFERIRQAIDKREKQMSNRPK